MALRDFRISAGMFVAALMVLVLGVLLLAAGWWIAPIAEGEQAMRDGNLEQALERYTAARARFDRLPAARSALPGVYDLVSENELFLLYSLARHDEILQKMETPGTSEAASFWAGCVLFGKGLAEEKPEARLTWVTQAHQAFRRSLELTPEDWDTKFNFELTGKLTSALQKQPQMSKPDMMKLLREPPKTDRPAIRRIG